MDAIREQFRRHLERGDLSAAQSCARQLIEAHGGPPKTAAVEVAREAAALYRQFLADPVAEFADAAPHGLGAEAGEVVQKALQRLFRIAGEWEAKLFDVHRERLARELRDYTRDRRYDLAQERFRNLLDAVPEADRGKQAEYIGAALGSLVNQADNARRVLRDAIGKAPEIGLPPESAPEMLKRFEDRLVTTMKSRQEGLELEWSRRLVTVQNDIRNAMPEKNKMDEPDEAVLRDVGDIFRSLARVPLRFGDPLYPDLLVLLADFCPGEVAATAAAAGVEVRSYSLLGFTARKSVLLTFQELGKSPRFTGPYMAWLEKNLGGDYARRGVEVAGALRSEAFRPLFTRLLDDKRFADIRSRTVDALGDVAGAEAAGTLLADLKKICKKGVRDSAELRAATALLQSLGKVVRTPRTSLDERLGIAREVVATVPATETRLALAATQQILAFKTHDLDPVSKHYAITALTSALWLPDDSSALAKGGERQANILGFRAPIVESLKRVAKEDFPFFLKELAKYELRYGAAYMAVAEVLEAAADPAAAPHLERMLLTALRHAQSPGSKYEAEFYWDAAAQQRVELSLDKVCAPLIHALGKVGGDEGKRLLADIEQQINVGRMPLPGEESSKFLRQFVGMANVKQPPPVGGAAAPEPEPAPVHADPAEVRELVKAVTSSYFLKGADKRRVGKITALTRLGQLVPLEALGAVIEQFADKDLLVSAAAVTSASQYAMPDKPKAVRTAALNALAEAAESKDPAIRVGVQKTLREIGPSRQDVKPILELSLKSARTPEARGIFMDLLKGASIGGQPTRSSQMVPKMEGESGPSEQHPPAAADPLTAKRDYLNARRAWIAGGKKGPPPVPPPGFGE
ncbi:MAG: hypothetical protein SF028_00375 [Candidatus Sumerlaeia bacterium]|nr:hypothetical protein [Candidatus Sumerlaeia bacterium]